MSNLEEQIQSWRNSLARALSDRTDVIDELESHLRDDIERLVAEGRSPNEAFQVAAGRIGEPRKIAAEFSKAAARWLPAQLSVWLTIASALVMMLVLATSHRRGQMTLLLAVHIFAVTIGYVGSLLFGITAMLAIVSRARGRFQPTHGEALKAAGFRIAAAAAALTLIGITLGMIWSREHLGNYWQWDPRETGALCVLAWNCLLLSRLRRPALIPASAMLGGVIGNLIVLMAWFGANLGRSLPDGYRPILCALVLGHLALTYCVMLPAGWLSARSASIVRDDP